MAYIWLLTFSVASCPRLPVSKGTVPVSAISRAWITTDIFKHSAVYCTNKAVQLDSLARWVIVAPLLAERPGVVKVSKVSGFWAHSCSADELVSWYFGPGGWNDKKNNHTSQKYQKSSGPAIAISATNEVVIQQSLPLIGRPADQEESETIYNALLEVPTTSLFCLRTDRE